MSKKTVCDICHRTIGDPGVSVGLHKAEIILYVDEVQKLDVHIGCLLRGSNKKLSSLITEHSYVFSGVE